MNLLIDGFDLFGINISFYGILIATGFIVAFFVATKLAKFKGYSKELPYNMLLIIFPLAIVGARLYYVAFSGTSWTFLEILQVWNGGLAIYGGVIASALGIVVYALITKKNILALFDLAVPCLIIGQAIGRWGNFLNQEAYGSLISNASLQWFPFGVYIENSHFTSDAISQLITVFGTSNVTGAWFYATFFYESIWCLLGFVFLILLYKKTNKLGLCTSFYFAFYGLGRFFIEWLRTDSLFLWNTGIRISQVLSLILFVVGIIGIVLSTKWDSVKQKIKR